MPNPDGTTDQDIVRFDLNRDSVIDEHDLKMLLAHYGTKGGDPRFLYCLDFDGDGEIGIRDVVAMTVHYGQKTGSYAYGKTV